MRSNKEIKKSVRGKTMIQTIKMINFPPFSATSKIIPAIEWSKKASNSYYGVIVYKQNSDSGIEKDRTEDVRVELSRSKMCMRSSKEWQFNRGGTKQIFLTDQCLFSGSITVDKLWHWTRTRNQVHQRPTCHQRGKLFSFIRESHGVSKLLLVLLTI